MANRDDAAVMLMHNASEEERESVTQAHGEEPSREIACEVKMGEPVAQTGEIHVARSDSAESVPADEPQSSIRPAEVSAAEAPSGSAAACAVAADGETQPDGTPSPRAQEVAAGATQELFGLPVREPSVCEPQPSTAQSAAGELFGLAIGEPVEPLEQAAQADGDAEWLDLSTRWLIASSAAPLSEADDPDADWAASLGARVAAATDARGSAPPPPPKARTERTRDSGAYERPPAPGRHRTSSGLQPQLETPSPSAVGATQASAERPSIHPPGSSSATHSEPDPWREEPSYTDSRQPPTAAGWAGPGYGVPPVPLPPWAAALPAYVPPPWAAAMPSYALPPWASGALTPWAAAQGVVAPAGVAAPGPIGPGVADDRASTRASGLAGPVARPRQRRAADDRVEPWGSIVNAWLTTVGKLALAALALHYSGLAEPILARFGYAPAAASAPLSAPPALAAPASVIAPSVASLPAQPQTASPQPSHPPPAHPAKRPPAARRNAREETERQAAVREEVDPASAPRPPTAAEHPDSAPESPAAAHDKPIAAEPAILRINSRPWSEVYVDGSLVGHTPQLGLRVSAGSHRIRLVNPELGVSKNLELEAAPGETLSRVELLAQ